MQFQVGEEVVFLRESGGGIVRRIDKNQYFIEDETGFERPFKEKDIAKVHSKDFYLDTTAIQKITEEDTRKNNKSFTVKQQRTGARKSVNVWELDLHMENLVESHRGMSNAEILQKQMITFRSFYQRARSKKVRKIIIIHGVGQGVLKSEVRQFLLHKEGVEFYDANYREYGKGATAVEIRYNI